MPGPTPPQTVSADTRSSVALKKPRKRSKGIENNSKKSSLISENLLHIMQPLVRETAFNNGSGGEGDHEQTNAIPAKSSSSKTCVPDFRGEMLKAFDRVRFG